MVDHLNRLIEETTEFVRKDRGSLFDLLLPLFRRGLALPGGMSSFTELTDTEAT
jgi:hypothetical protein